MDNKWIIGIIGGFSAFVIANLITCYTFRTNLEMTQKIEMIRLAREFTKDFYETPDNIIYGKIRSSIESCQQLYKSWGGQFTHDEINRYLGFFDDLDFTMRRVL
jgi:hypothetical protein